MKRTQTHTHRHAHKVKKTEYAHRRTRDGERVYRLPFSLSFSFFVDNFKICELFNPSVTSQYLTKVLKKPNKFLLDILLQLRFLYLTAASFSLAAAAATKTTTMVVVVVVVAVVALVVMVVVALTAGGGGGGGVGGGLLLTPQPELFLSSLRTRRSPPRSRSRWR